MARLIFTVSIPLLIVALMIGFSDARAAGQLEKVCLAVEGMV